MAKQALQQGFACRSRYLVQDSGYNLKKHQVSGGDVSRVIELTGDSKGTVAVSFAKKNLETH